MDGAEWVLVHFVDVGGLVARRARNSCMPLSFSSARVPSYLFETVISMRSVRLRHIWICLRWPTHLAWYLVYAIDTRQTASIRCLSEKGMSLNAGYWRHNLNSSCFRCLEFHLIRFRYWLINVLYNWFTRVSLHRIGICNLSWLETSIFRLGFQYLTVDTFIYWPQITIKRNHLPRIWHFSVQLQ